MPHGIAALYGATATPLEDRIADGLRRGHAVMVTSIPNPYSGGRVRVVYWWPSQRHQIEKEIDGQRVHFYPSYLPEYDLLYDRIVKDACEAIGANAMPFLDFLSEMNPVPGYGEGP